MCAEFGCYTGGTLGQIVEYLSSSSSSHTKIYGFDSFEGLPENWYNGKGKGWFNLNSKEISVSGAVIIKGWFEDTVPGFFRDALSVSSSVLGLVHIDSDLYSSAKVVLNELGRFLRESAQFRTNAFPLYLVFDELINYPDYAVNELKALLELQQRSGRSLRVLGTQALTILRRREDIVRALAARGGTEMPNVAPYQQDAAFALL